MMGVNIMSYSHFDEYLVDFTAFRAGAIENADKVFAVPQQCKEQQQQQGGGSRQGAASAGLLGTLAAMPWVHLPGEPRGGGAGSSSSGRVPHQHVLKAAWHGWR
jgi:hypothetical protein